MMVTGFVAKPVGCNGKPASRLGSETHGPARAWQHHGFLVDPVQVKLNLLVQKLLHLILDFIINRLEYITKIQLKVEEQLCFIIVW